MLRQKIAVCFAGVMAVFIAFAISILACNANAVSYPSPNNGPPIRLGDNPYAIPIGNAGGGVGGTYPSNLVLLLGDASCLDGQLPNGYQQPQIVANDLAGTTGDAAVIAIHGSGSSPFTSAGTNVPVYSNSTIWVPLGGDGGVYSWTNLVSVTTVSSFANCGQWIPITDTSTVWTCYVMCQDATAYLDGGGHTNGHNFSGSLQFNVTQPGTSTPVLNPSAPTFQSIASNVLTGTAQAIVSGSVIQLQVENTTASTEADCTCACSGVGGR